MSEESKHMDDSPNPKLNMPSSDSTIGGQNPSKHPPLRQPLPKNMKEVSLFEIEEVSHPTSLM
jgi:hypothetical protein